jgi:TetR/AcrR family transcriptional repressor of bet genes
MGRRPNTDLRRQQIVEAFLHELAGVGYERTSTKSIAARAGLAPGLVHYHFASKEAILLALVDRLIEDADARYAERIPTDDTAARRLAAFVSSRVGLGSESDAIQVRAWVNIIAEAMGQPRVRQRVVRWLGRNRTELQRLFAAAGSTEPMTHTAMLLAMILGAFSLHSLQLGGIPPGYAEPGIQHWLASALRKPSSPRRS